MIRLLAALLLAIPMFFSTVFAISQAQLEGDPGRYKLLFSTETQDEYVDVQSIQSIRYKPPYYQIKATVYAVNFYKGMIAKFTNIYSYDYDRSVENIVKAGGSKKEMAKEFVRDNGLSFRFEYMQMFRLNGEPLSDNMYIDPLEVDATMPVPLDSPAYHVSMFVFYKVYNMYFNPPLEGQLF